MKRPARSCVQRPDLQPLARVAGKALLASIILSGLAVPARAGLIINATFDGTITSDPNAATIEKTINQAIQTYENSITTPITVAITFSEMTSGLGQSSTFFGTVSYSAYLAALQSHAFGSNDATALAHLAAGPNNPVNGNTNIDVTTANLRALGFSANVATDSTISLNTSIMNLDRTSIDPSKFDLLAVAEHEIDEALGLGSNLDTGSTTGAIRPEDLFRYSANGVRSYTTSSSATSYFSIDGGATDLVGFNQVGPPGGSDYGDWASSATPRVQDAFGTPGSTPNLGVELTALDVIGYNFVPVPEPSSCLMLAVGLVSIGLRLRRRTPAGGAAVS